MLVYNTNTTTGKGYYFWDGSKWTKILDSNGNSDEDWHKATTSTSPSSINDAIFTNGNVGIGLNNPLQAIDINAGHIQVQTGFGIGRQIGHAGNEHMYYPFRLGLNSLGQYGSLLPTDGGMTLESDHIIALIETDSDNLIGWFDVNQDEFIWDGKIGIGTETPGAQLTIKGDARIRLDNNINNQWDFNVDNTNGKFAIEQYTNLVSDGKRFVITTDGKVGIGQNAPTHRLEIKHNIAEYAVRIFNTEDAAGNGLIIESNGGSDDDTLLFIKGDLNGVPADKFIVVGDGRVGINHSTPDPITKLDVNGYMIGKSFLFSAYSTNTVTAANGNISFSETNDPHSDYASNAYTAPIDGYYFFSTNITFDGGAGTDDTFNLKFTKNGTASNNIPINPHYQTNATGKEINISHSAIIFLTAGDVIAVNLSGVDTGVVRYLHRNFMGYMISK